MKAVTAGIANNNKIIITGYPITANEPEPNKTNSYLNDIGSIVGRTALSTLSRV